MRKYTRQIRLKEVGEAGQARLAAATIAPSASRAWARTIEATYLRAAGVGTVSDAQGDLHVDVGSLGIRDDAARDFAEGALAALVAMKKVLDA